MGGLLEATPLLAIKTKNAQESVRFHLPHDGKKTVFVERYDVCRERGQKSQDGTHIYATKAPPPFVCTEKRWWGFDCGCHLDSFLGIVPADISDDEMRNFEKYVQKRAGCCLGACRPLSRGCPSYVICCFVHGRT